MFSRLPLSRSTLISPKVPISGAKFCCLLQWGLLHIMSITYLVKLSSCFLTVYIYMDFKRSHYYEAPKNFDCEGVTHMKSAFQFTNLTQSLPSSVTHFLIYKEKYLQLFFFQFHPRRKLFYIRSTVIPPLSLFPLLPPTLWLTSSTYVKYDNKIGWKGHSLCPLIIWRNKVTGNELQNFNNLNKL